MKRKEGIVRLKAGATSPDLVTLDNGSFAVVFHGTYLKLPAASELMDRVTRKVNEAYNIKISLLNVFIRLGVHEA